VLVRWQALGLKQKEVAMVAVSFEVPDDLVQALGDTPAAAGREIRLAAAMHWCRRGEMSTSKAARLAGLTYADFLDAAARRKVELFPLDIDELKEEVARGLPAGGQCVPPDPPGQG
jgi:predicted HTH domain antitoxin